MIEVELLLLAVLILAFVARKPASVDDLRIVNSPDSLVELAWDVPGSSDVFRVYRSEDGGRYKYIGSTSRPSFTDTNADVDGEYSYSVTAFRGLRKSDAVSVNRTEYPQTDSTVTCDTVFESVDEAAAFLRKAMTERASEVKMSVYTDEDVSQEVFDKSLEHTGNPKEGDYLKFQYKDCVAERSLGNGVETLTFHVRYNSTLEQEQEVDAEVSSILDKLDLEGKSDYEKIRAIYSYVRNSTDYDLTQYDDNNVKRTAYSALVKGETVCQGYSLAMYRLLLESGVDTRIVYGLGVPKLGPSGAHSWNIVQCNGDYYYMDSTWDDMRGRYFLNLQTQGDFEKSHINKEEYAEKEFINKYNIAAAGAEPRTSWIKRLFSHM